MILNLFTGGDREWYWIVLACVLTALAIRLDSLLIGPYFAFAGACPWLGGH